MSEKGTPVWKHLANGKRRAMWLKRDHKPKATTIVDWAQGAIAEIRRLERELNDRDKTIAELERQIDKQESRIGQLLLEIENLKNGRMV